MDTPTTALLESIIAGSGDAIITVDERLIIRSWNRGAQAIYGYTPEEAIGQHVSMLAPEELKQEAEQLVKTLEKEGVIRGYETTRQTKAGTRIAVQFTATRLMDDQGKPTGYISVIIREITGRKALEQRLESKVKGLFMLHEIGRALLETTDLDEILYIVLVGVTAGQALKFNRAFLFLVDDARVYLEGRLAVGPSSPEEAGRIWTELAAKQLTLNDILRSFRKETSAQDSRVNEVVRQVRIAMTDTSHILVRALHTRTTFNVTDVSQEASIPPDFLNLIESRAFVVTPLVSRERPFGVLLADNHITGRPIVDEDVELLEIFAQQASGMIEKSYLYETQARQVQALEEANQNLKLYQERLIRAERLSAIGEMAATVAHEIRNPLVSIGGFARVLLETVPEDAPHRDYLDIIIKETTRLEEILTELLDLARPVEMKTTPTDLNELIGSCLRMLEEDCRKRHIDADMRLQSDLPPIPADADQVKQVLLNILKNALDAMQWGGHLSVWTRPFNHACVEVGIADTGVGIPVEDVEKIFQPFFTTKPGGSGLGLTVAQRIIKDHGGTIHVERNGDAGTTFLLHLPIRQQPEPSMHPAAASMRVAPLHGGRA